MKNHDLVWIPFFGIYFLKFNPFIIRYEPWMQYQIISILLLGAYLLYKVYLISIFLMYIF